MVIANKAFTKKKAVYSIETVQRSKVDSSKAFDAAVPAHRPRPC